MSGLSLPALAGTAGQLQPDLIAVVVVILILGLVALLRCRREDIPAIVRALTGMGHRDDGDDPPSLPKP